ncbi:hypothetical protein CALVIDRAFT_540856 [Calocera viscosa TUFC12733]|uniref:Uncharacterized protein n=1 Tax=Calocera viscosa (strain TUFC12733) TaxID=1330018 RepID=A0A167IFD2_CALVF|nr:hypothetical protein CALVIDRAFT_540856 [Calocera viscosa TUFC12733]
MAPTATLVASTQSHAQSGVSGAQRRPPGRPRPVANRLHNRSHSSTKLTTTGLALTQAHPENPAQNEEPKPKRRIKSVEDITLLRPHGSTASLSRPRPTSRLSNKRTVTRQPSVGENVKVAGAVDDEDWTSESGASSPTQAPDEGDQEDEEDEEYDGPEIRIRSHVPTAPGTHSTGRASPDENRSPTPTLQKTTADPSGLSIQTEFPALPSPEPYSNKALYRAPRSPHTPGRLRPMALIRPPSFASAVVTAPPVLDKQTVVLSGPDSPASDLLPDSPKPASSAHERTPSIAPSISSVVPSRVRTISAMSGASATASRAMDALNRANANTFLASHFPHVPPQDQVHHLLPSKFVPSHMAVKRARTPVDDAVARIRPTLKAV